MPPNIVCVSVDSLRADFCSFLEPRERTTPFLSSLSDGATVYESAIAPSLWTLPVHTSIFTGLFPPEHGIATGSQELGDHPTLAELLSDVGYATGAFYSNGWLDTVDILRGFDTTRAPDSGPSRVAEISKRIELLSSRMQSVAAHVYNKFYENPKDDYYGRTKEALGLIEEWRSRETSLTGKDAEGEHDVDEVVRVAADVEEQFFLFLHLNEAHWRYVPPNPHHRTFTDRPLSSLVKNAVYWQDRVYESRRARLETMAGDITPPEREVETFRNLYRGCIHYCDCLVRKLVEGLKSAGVWENTVFVLFGDHGESFGEWGVFGHHFSMDDSVLRVPLLVRDPTGRIPSSRVSDPVSLVDVYPTLLGIADADGLENSGVGLSATTRNEAYSYYDVSEHNYYTNDYGVSKADIPPPIQHTVWRSESQRLTHFPLTDGYRTAGNDENELRELLREHRAGFDVLENDSTDIREDVRRRLEDVGYLQ